MENNNNLNSQPKQEIIQEMNFSKTNVKKLNEEISQELKNMHEILMNFKRDMIKTKLYNYNELEKRIKKLEENAKKINTNSEKNNKFLMAINSLNNSKKDILEIINCSFKKIEEQCSFYKNFEENFKINYIEEFKNVDMNYLITFKKIVKTIIKDIAELNSSFKSSILKMCNELQNFIEKTENYFKTLN